MSKTYTNPETIGLHAGWRKDDSTNSVAVPIHQTSSFQFDDCDHAANLFALSELGNIYSRIMNPTCAVLEDRIAALEGGVGALAVASGQAASAYAIQNIARKGDNIVASSHLYGGTYNQFKNPMCSIILRKVFGVAGAAHTNHMNFKFRFAWPSADTGSLPFEGGIEAAYKSEISQSKDPEKFIKDKYVKLNSFTSPFRTAEKFLLENVIDPRDTRKEACIWIKLAYKKLRTGSSYFGYRP